MVGVYLDKPQDSWVLSVDNYRGGVFDVWLRWATNVYMPSLEDKMEAMIIALTTQWCTYIVHMLMFI